MVFSVWCDEVWLHVAVKSNLIPHPLIQFHSRTHTSNNSTPTYTYHYLLVHIHSEVTRRKASCISSVGLRPPALVVLRPPALVAQGLRARLVAEGLMDVGVGVSASVAGSGWLCGV